MAAIGMRKRHASASPSPPSARLSDWAHLMTSAQGGDAAAYRRLLREVTPFLRRFARAHGLDAVSCDDLAQDVLLSLHRVRHTYDPSRPFAPWLLSIAHRRLIDSHRRDARIRHWEGASLDLLEGIADPASVSHAVLAESRDWLGRAVQTLPPKQREALLMVKLRELSVAEAAARSRQSVGAIKVNVHRAVRKLRGIVPQDSKDAATV